MRLLVITRRVDKDDSQTGFAYDWIKRFAQQTEKLRVICLEMGNIVGLPDNTEVFSMGKEKGKNRLKEFLNFQKGTLKFIGQVDCVFCHQNPIYTILIAPYAKLRGKKIVTWYSHKEINWQVRLINVLADKIVTPTQEGFGLQSAKKVVLGHGIDTDKFNLDFSHKPVNCLEIVVVGRFSPIKDYETLINAVELLRKRGDLQKPVRVKLIGAPGLTSQQAYYDKIVNLVKQKKLDHIVTFVGLIPNTELAHSYQSAHLSVNLCPTGSPDKVVLESMACGTPALACNKTFSGDFGRYQDRLIFKEKNAIDLADKIADLLKTSNDDMQQIGLFLRGQVVARHNLDCLIKKIISCFER